MTARSAFFLLTAGLATCNGGGPARPAMVPLGAWGGDHAALTVGPDGAVADFDCAHGRAAAPLALDAAGAFDVPGVFVRERGGPVREGDVLPEVPARYRGRLEDARLTLTLFLIDERLEVGPFRLALGATPRLFKCL